MAKALTVAALNKIKPDPSKRLEIPDGVVTGLYLVVQPTGRKSWAVRYRGANGKPRKMVMGNCLTGADPKKVGAELTRIRGEAAAILEQARHGEDPAAEKQAAKKVKATTAADDFAGVAKTFIRRYARPKNRSWQETARQLGLKLDADSNDLVIVKDGICDKWGDRLPHSITKAEIVTLLDEISDRGSPIMANRVLATLRKLFNWARSRGIVTENPAKGIERPGDEISRDRVLSDDEIRLFWQATAEIGEPFGPLFRTLLLTAQRRTEVGEMTDSEIAGDVWTIPKNRAKNGIEHIVHLSPPALDELASIKRVKSDTGWIFSTNGKAPVSGYSKAKERVDALMSDAVPAWKLHDLRRTAASGMAAIGVNMPVVEKILNHISGSFGGVQGVYQRAELLTERKAALNAWGRYVLAVADADLWKAVQAWKNAPKEDDEKFQREEDFRHAIMRGGERWEAFLKIAKAEAGKVVMLRQSEAG